MGFCEYGSKLSGHLKCLYILRWLYNFEPLDKGLSSMVLVINNISQNNLYLVQPTTHVQTELFLVCFCKYLFLT
jgi:hypothetical protein